VVRWTDPWGVKARWGGGKQGRRDLMDLRRRAANKSSAGGVENQGAA